VSCRSLTPLQASSPGCWEPLVRRHYKGPAQIPQELEGGLEAQQATGEASPGSEDMSSSQHPGARSAAAGWGETGARALQLLASGGAEEAVEVATSPDPSCKGPRWGLRWVGGSGRGERGGEAQPGQEGAGPLPSTT